MARKFGKDYSFVFKCDLERFKTIKFGYTKADLKKLEDNIGPNGWGNWRLKFQKSNGRPFGVLIDPKVTEKNRPPIEDDIPEKAPWEREEEPPEDADKKKTPF